MTKVIESLEARKDWLALKLHDWDGPLHMGAHGRINQEFVALEHAIALVKAELQRRHISAMEVSLDQAA